MKLVNTVLMAAILMGSLSSFAINGSKYKGMNLALTCGDIDIVNSEYTTKVRGALVNGKMDLGQTVIAVKGNSQVELVKTQDAEKTLFGHRKGFGLFDGGILRLDLRNTETNEIYLEDTQTGQKIACHIHGDCC